MPLDATNYRPEPTDPTLRTLIRAREILEKGWCKAALAKDARGRAVKPSDPAAVSWCLAGAAFRAALKERSPTYAAATLEIIDALPACAGESIGIFNDQYDTTKDDVLRILDRAISCRPFRRLELEVAAESVS